MQHAGNTDIKVPKYPGAKSVNATVKTASGKLNTTLGAALAAIVLTVNAAGQEESRDPVPASRPPAEAQPDSGAPLAQPEAEPPPPALPEPQEPTSESTKPAEVEPASPAEPVEAETSESKTSETDEESTPKLAATPAHDPANRAEQEAFFDGILLTQLESEHVAGATVAVVADGEIVFAKGYGFADYDERKPVDPETSMFRIGSVSKLLTWTAVMQLVEQGKLDLDADINEYLEGTQVKIPETFAEPITLKHLLTHSPGFEDLVIGLFGKTAADLSPLEELLSEQVPRRVRKPGEVASYSNHGTALAGLIVERVSGVPWAEYIEQKILEPLGMANTLVRQPAADDLPEAMSKGYKYKGGRFEEEDFEYVPAAPAGSASSSAVDMARFMLAHLQNGRYASQRILEESTARQMRERLFEHDSRLDAMCYGFWETNHNGQRILHHGGDTILFHSLLAFIPEAGVGFFISYNTDTGTGRDALLKAYLDRFFPLAEKPRIDPPVGFEERADRYTGTYKMIRHDYSSLAKLQALVAVLEVTADEDDTLVVSGMLGSSGSHYAEVDDLLFQKVDGQAQLAFREDESGRITHLFLGDLPAIALQRVAWYESPKLHLPLLAGCALIFLSAALGWPFVLLVTRGRLIAGNPSSFMSLLSTWLAWIGCIVYLVFLGGIGFMVSDPNQIVYGLSPELEMLLLLPQVCVGIAALVFLCAMLSWGKRYWRFSGRVHYLLVALAGVGFAWFLYCWNLLRFGAQI